MVSPDVVTAPPWGFGCLIPQLDAEDGGTCHATESITESQNHRITESQNHRITESQNGRGWKGPLWVTQSNPLPKQGHPEQAAQHRVQVGLEYLQRRRLHSLPGQPRSGIPPLSSWRAWGLWPGGWEGQGASRWLWQHLPIAYCAFRAAGGEPSVSRSLRNRALISSPMDVYWPGTRSCSRDAYRVATARIIGRLPRSVSVHVSLRRRSGYGTHTKHQPSIIQLLRATVYVSVRSRADPASRLLGQGGPP